MALRGRVNYARHCLADPKNRTEALKLSRWRGTQPFADKKKGLAQRRGPTFQNSEVRFQNSSQISADFTIQRSDFSIQLRIPDGIPSGTHADRARRSRPCNPS